jgi:uncharacterized protein (DUF3084 family)
MKKIVLLVLFLLLPAYAGAAYTIYLKNGAEIPEVTSYSESGGDVYLYFGTGSMIVPKKDILRIGGSETTEKETARGKTESPQDTRRSQETQPPQEQPASPESHSPPPAETNDKTARLNELRNELNSLSSELKNVQEQESSLVKEINEKTGRRFSYNLYQIKQLEKELEPLRAELANVQQRKTELMQRKGAIENDMKELQ